MCGFLLTSGRDINYHNFHLKKISNRGQDSTNTTLINNNLIISHCLLSISSKFKHIQPYPLKDDVFKDLKIKLLDNEIRITDNTHFVFNGETP